jgi:hypothetical protein
LAGLIVSSALGLTTVPAQAFSIGGLGTSTNGSLSFTQDTTVDFTFLESRGFYQSKFGVIDLGTNTSSVLFAENSPGYDPGSSDANGDWLGTCGITVTPAPCKVGYTFKAGSTYQFFLDYAPYGVTYTDASGDFNLGVPTGTPGLPAAPVYDGGTFRPSVPSQAFISNAQSYTRSTIGPGAGGGGFTTIDMQGYDFFTAINDNNEADKDVNDFTVAAKVRKVPEPATLAGLGLVAGALAFSRRRGNKTV